MTRRVARSTARVGLITRRTAPGQLDLFAHVVPIGPPQKETAPDRCNDRRGKHEKLAKAFHCKTITPLPARRVFFALRGDRGEFIGIGSCCATRAEVRAAIAGDAS
jgi:hypothetical protein